MPCALVYGVLGPLCAAVVICCADSGGCYGAVLLACGAIRGGCCFAGACLLFSAGSSSCSSAAEACCFGLSVLHQQHPCFWYLVFWLLVVCFRFVSMLLGVAFKHDLYCLPAAVLYQEVGGFLVSLIGVWVLFH